ncbi:MAG: S-layer homology domain-containing protein [Firmicutes bacterium]|nr:S-layer homology domain-containing protein [Bacillota bacterium]
MNSTDWFHKEVSDAYNNGFVSGTSTTKFSPYETMTRGQFVTILGRIAEVNPNNYKTSRFNDVNIKEYYGPYVTWAYDNKIVSGVGNNRFEPNSKITREQIAVILNNYINAKGYRLPYTVTPAPKFRDTNKISSWAASGMEAMRLYGIISGDTNGYCNPQKSAPRAEGTAMLQRFYEQIRATERTKFPLNKFTVPTRAQINADTNPHNSRSPYIYGWMDIPDGVKFIEYSVDFRAEYLPRGTYCCLGQWTMDMSGLESKYTNIRTEYSSVSGYAGFQSTCTAKGKAGIMSFWDIYAKEKSTGKNVTLRAKCLYPGGNDNFGGEGTGAHSINHYNWEEGHWYRMLLQCDNSGATTVVNQFVCDLETGTWTLLCQYDTLVPNGKFKGDIAVFLENYNTSLAGEVRSLELKNVRYRDASTGQWNAVKRAYLGPNGGVPAYEGSYEFGATSDRFWMITSGVGGDWYGNGTGQKAGYYNVTQAESGAPYN